VDEIKRKRVEVAIDDESHIAAPSKKRQRIDTSEASSNASNLNRNPSFGRKKAHHYVEDVIVDPKDPHKGLRSAAAEADRNFWISKGY